jgi:hypothetical protein
LSLKFKNNIDPKRIANINSKLQEDTMAGTTEGGKKASEGGRGNPEKASPAAIERYLKGINFPANKEALIKHAKGNQAPQDILPGHFTCPESI